MRFCAIPLIRGPTLRCRWKPCWKEARKLAAGGVRELVVIAQDTTYYGLDFTANDAWPNCSSPCARIDGIRWIRLTTPTPAFPDGDQ